MDNVEDINIWEISRRFLYQYCPVYLFYTVLLSLCVHLAIEEIGFISNMLYTLVLSVLMYLFAVMPIILFKPAKSFTRRMAMILFSLIFSGFLFITYSRTLNLNPFLSPIPMSQMAKIMGLNFLSLGIIICWFYYIEEKQYIAEKKIVAERTKRINNEKMVAETHLRLLQAQIEPHFLFNTLTSIFSLTDTDPRKAKEMHDNFMQYLKTTLNKTRSSVTTIAQEIELITAYLDIFKVRMGKRLRYSVETDDEVSGLPFPSMLIQPIVENAIKHGLEPKIEGGEIHIQVKKIERNRIRWNIEDTGLGMSEKSHLGTGLSNTMERIEALYGKEGSLALKENQPSGVRVILEVPYV